ncbi:MAG: hypothetical protein JSR59_01600 [Proteobacteria bacterium]|nr:hypothetical protein [Pseudomonadota bacterium]
MIRISIVLCLVVANTCWACPSSSVGAQAVEELARTKPSMHWNQSSMVCADFDGDGKLDQAIIGTEDNKVAVAVRRNAAAKRPKLQILEFTVGHGLQAAICELPVRLEVDNLVCRNEDGPLPGRKEGRNARSLDLIDGECDSIHIYWSHVHKGFVWWRR